MDITRLGVLIWLFLPIPVYGVIQHWYYAQVKKYPSTTSGKIGDVSYSFSSEYDEVGGTNVTYVFNVAGTEYTGRATLGGRHHKPGQEMPFPIRYNPNRPEESRLDDLHGVVRRWVLWVLFVLCIDLGLSFFCFFIGLLCIFAGVTIALRRASQLQHLQSTQLRRIFYSFLCILIGIPFIAIGVYVLIIDGFLAQNILWAFWNHQTLDGAPW